MMTMLKNIEWVGDAATGHLRLLDQTLLPERETYIDCRDVDCVWDAIKRLCVRGAPAIGIAAAFGCVIGGQLATTRDARAIREAMNHAGDHLATSRPTAVNLFWAIDRMKRLAAADDVTLDRLLAEAKAIHAEDAAMCRAIGGHAWERMKRHMLPDAEKLSAEKLPGAGLPGGVLTHCNAGALATGGIGTATAPMYLAAELGHPIAVYADETRPLLQGSRLTAFELGRAGVDVTLICDNMAAQVMREGRVRCVITGADRIAANGDAANKIGTYGLAVLAKRHGLPFFVAAPSSTFDLSIASGDEIPIELRAADEITQGFGKRTAPAGVKTYSPAFDVTPAELITALITERGVIEPVTAANVRAVVG